MAIVKGTQSLFVSAEVTADGSAQSTAHSLGGTPTSAVAMLTGVPTSLTQLLISITAGTHDSTNCIFTVTTGNKYRIIAWL